MFQPPPECRHRKPFAGFAPLRPDNSIARNVARLAGELPSPISVRWSDSTAGPRSIRGALTPGERGEPAAIARSFLAGRASLFGIDEPSSLALKTARETRSGRHVLFDQYHLGMRVIGGCLIVHIDSKGAVRMVNGEYHHKIDISDYAPFEKLISVGEAVSIAGNDLGVVVDGEARHDTELVVCMSSARYILAYRVVVSATKPLGSWLYIIDAKSGEIIRAINLSRFAVGRVYLTNPREDPNLSDVEMNNLIDGTNLTGVNAKVENEDCDEAFSNEGKFLYDPANTHFDEVMAYYHVDEAHARYASIDPRIDSILSPDVQIPVVVHYGDRFDNAYYDPYRRGLFFGDGEALNDLAKEACIIYHEYDHYILDHINPDLKGAEADALHEGYSDYFGCSFTDDAQIGEWATARTGKPHMRDLLNEKAYPGDMTGEPHADGEIWGGACWDIRERLGNMTADMLVYESMHYLPEFARFSDAALGMVEADARISGGSNGKTLREIFRKRGILKEETMET